MGTRSHYYDHVTDERGNVLAGASVNVYQQGTTTVIAETMYAGDTGVATTLANPLTADDDGKVEFWLNDPKRVDLKISAPGKTARTVTVDVTRTANDGRHSILDAGSLMTARAGLNFGAGFDLTDDSGNDEIEIVRSAIALDDLSDVSTAGAATNEVVTYNGSSYVLASPVLGDVLDYQTVIKTSDETVGTNTTVQNDDALLFAIGANETWAFTMTVFWSDGGGDLKWGITGPSGCGGSWGILTHSGAGNVTGGTIGSGLTYSAIGATTGATDRCVLIISGIARNGSTAGNIRFVWAQSSSNASVTTVHEDSFIETRRLA